MSRSVLFAIGSVILAVLVWFCITNHIPSMESDIDSRTRELLSSQGLDFVRVEVEGRDVILDGEATDAEEIEEAVRLASGVYGVHRVKNRLRIARPVERPKRERDTNMYEEPFAMDLRLEDGSLTVTGLVTNEEEKQLLLSAARTRFGEERIKASLTFSSTLPDGWLPAILQLLEYLGEMRSGTISVNNEGMRLAGIVTDERQRYQLARAIHMRWPPPFRVEVRLGLPLAGYAAACQKKVQAILAENQIEFQSKSAKFLAESLLPLSQIAKVLDGCRDANLLVAVHSDNETDSEINLITTRARAMAIRDYLLARGIGKERVLAQGLGDTRPLAPNDTERGRALNRRIEFIVLEN